MDQIEVKLRQLGSKLDNLSEQNKGLRQENEQLKAERDRQSGTLAALQDKLERSQQTLTKRDEGNEPPGDDLRQQIDHYLREIDKCIGWLSRQ